MKGENIFSENGHPNLAVSNNWTWVMGEGQIEVNANSWELNESEGGRLIIGGSMWTP